MKLLRALVPWSWVATLPICVFFYLWASATIGAYLRFGVKYDTFPMRFPLWETGRDEFRHMLRRMQIAVFPDGLRGADHADDLRTISLFVAERNLAELDSDLPESGFEYVEGGIWDGEKVRNARVRYRGDFARHWAWSKKSWRVKTRKSALFEGLREFNLIVPKFPEHLNNYLAYRLAQRMDLLAPRVEMVHVRVNGEMEGVHILCEQLEEMTLRSNGFMPGDLYSGDLVAKDSYRGIPNHVFAHAGLWEKLSVNNHYPEEHRAPLERLLTLANSAPSERVHQDLVDLLDMEAWGRFSAFETLGRTFHYDAAHNWRLYYDLNRGKFVPVVWDPVGWANYFRFRDEDENLDVIVTRLHSLLFSNGDFLRARHRVVRDFFESGENVAFLEETDGSIARMQSALLVDPHVRPVHFDVIQTEMAELRQAISDAFDQAERAFVAPDGVVRFAALPGKSTIALSVEGRRPVERLIARFARPPPRSTSAAIRVYRQGEAADTDVSGALKVDGHRLEVDLGLLPKTSRFFTQTTTALANQRLRFSPGYYELVIGDLTGIEPVEVLVDRGGPALEMAEEVARLKPEDIGGLYRVTPERATYAPEVWRGVVQLEGIREVRSDLIIEPGTTVLLEPGASLIARGRLLAQGTAERPIRFEPAQPEAEPWGAVIIQGAASRGSRLRHCSFELGSGLKDDLREYSAMFSIHDSGSVRVESCSFRAGKIVDDMVHAVYSDVEFVDCTFEDALFDAVDLDICTATLQGCVFRGSGNDGLDLMTSRAVVADTLFEGNADKGISVGEGSTLFAVNNRFQKNLIGVQVKDGSQALLFNADFEGNGLAVDAYKKNWRYGSGGQVRVHKSRLAGNERGATADKHSRVVISDSYFDLERTDDVAGGKARVVFEATVDDLSEDTAADGAKEPMPELTSLEIRAAAVWGRFDPKLRGARLGGS